MVYTQYRLNLISNLVEETKVGRCARYEEAGLAEIANQNPCFLVVEANKNRWPDEKYEELKTRLNTILTTGEVTINGHKRYFELSGAGASDIRSDSFVMVEKTVAERYNKYRFASLNLDYGKIAKIGFVYPELVGSSSKPMKEALAWMNQFGIEEIDIKNMAVFNDIEKTVDEKVLIINNFKTYISDKYKITISDGVQIFIINDDDWDDLMREEFRKVATGFSTRYGCSWKGAAIPILKSDLKKALDHIGKGYVFPDAFKVKRNLLDLQLIGFVSSFKMIGNMEKFDSKGKKLSPAKQFANWQKKTWEAGQRFRVCLVSHDRLGHLSYQAMQQILGNFEYAVKVSKNVVDILKAYTMLEKAADLCGKKIAKAIKKFKFLMNDPDMQQAALSKFKSLLDKTKGGVKVLCSHGPMAFSDPYALLQGIAGVEITGVLQAGEVCCDIFKHNAQLGITRYPVTRFTSFIEMKNCRMCNEWARGLFIARHVAFFNVNDLAMAAMDMDYDGDHVTITDDVLTLEGIRATVELLEKLGMNIPVAYEAPKTPSVDITKENKINFLMTLVSAPIGLYANAYSFLRSELDHPAMNNMNQDYIMNMYKLGVGCGACVDAAKGTGGALFEELLEETIDEQNEYKLPQYMCAARNSILFNNEEFVKELRKRYTYKDYMWLENYSQLVSAWAPEFHIDLGEFEHEWTKQYVFETIIPVLTDGDYHTIEGLITGNPDFRGPNGTTTKYPTNRNQLGVFGKAVYDYHEQTLGASPAVRNEVLDQIKTDLIRFAYDKGKSIDELVNALVLGVYKRFKMNDTMKYKQLLWNLFGDEITANINKNLKVFDNLMDEDPEIDFEDEDNNEEE